MKIRYKKSRTFREPVFRTEVIVRYTGDLVLEGTDYIGATCSSQVVKGVKSYILTFSKIDIADLDHECMHLVSNVFMDRGIQIDLSNHSTQEIFGYYHCYWVDCIWSIIKKWA